MDKKVYLGDGGSMANNRMKRWKIVFKLPNLLDRNGQVPPSEMPREYILFTEADARSMGVAINRAFWELKEKLKGYQLRSAIVVADIVGEATPRQADSDESAAPLDKDWGLSKA